VQLADRTRVAQAIAAAQAAFPSWRNTPALKRARVMSAFKAPLEARADDICGLFASST